MTGTTTAVAKSLLTTEKVAESFLIVANELDKFDVITQNVKIEDDESLSVAENNAAQVKVLLTRAEAARKGLGDDYYNTWKAVNAYAKTLTDRLTAYKQRLAMAITDWKTVQEAAKREEVRKREEELAKKEEEKQVEASRLVRLTNTIYAKLYGGTYKTKNGEQLSSGCHTDDDCDALGNALFRSFPKASEFVYFPDRREKIYDEATKAIRNHKIDLMELKSNQEGIQKAAKSRIRKNKMEAGLVVEKTDQLLNKKIAAETKKEIRAGEKEIREVAKGTRKILKFRIKEEDKVTREFLSVDESKIRQWMEGQNTEIKTQLQAGSQPIAGVEFYVEITNISR